MTLIQQRRGLAATWTSQNPVLASGELGVETDTLKVKIGDGVKTWTALSYFLSADLAGKADVGHTHTAAQISDATAIGREILQDATAADVRATIGAGTSNLAIGTTATTAMRGDKTFAFSEITGVLSTSQIPSLAISDVFPVTSQTEMLALTAQRGDIAIRSDIGRSFILATENPGTLADWKQLSASGDVLSVAGKTGTVILTKSDVGLANVDNTSDLAKPISTATQTALNAKEPTLPAGTAAQYFKGDKTLGTLDKAAVGLSAVDNTSDLAKPVSTATQTALNAKANSANPTFTGTVTGVTKAHVGLGNVDNTSDLAKPISTATQTALNAKANSSHTHNAADILSIDGGAP
ncbi:minor tail protein [Arthrobacter phage Shambre1]|uniref:Minor tail protein n=1 Tax=Arthrobacter phage Shambre1 TaxID=2927284 RepID=A0A977KNL9_9CAUD|nr:minor tail protein [Arthrobacter phage Shambre1]UXE04785.1 minor tail protein [Arthrobacter phage Shambre1]